MEEIPEILRSDSFRQLIRDDLDFRQIRHKSILKKEQKFTDGMTQLMLNVIDKWQNHSRYSDIWNATKLSRDFQRQVCSTDQKSFCDVLERNGFVIDHQFFQPTAARKGETKAVFVPPEKIRKAQQYIRRWHLSHGNNGNQKFEVDWNQTFDFRGVPIPSRIRINTSVFSEFLESEELIEDESLSRKWNLQLRLIGAIENDGWLEQNYWVSPFGRLYGRGLSSLQSCPKVLLKQFLNEGAWELDVDTALQSILFQQLQQRTKREIHYPSIEEYMRNKKAIREEIADSLGVDSGVVKQQFTAIGFGMRRSTKKFLNKENGSLQNPTLTENFGGSELLAENFKRIGFVKSYWEELYDLTNRLTKAVRKENPLWMRSKEEGFSGKKQIMTYLFFQGEAEILRSICRQVGQHLILPKHDAVVISRRISSQEKSSIESGIYEDTGFRVGLSSKQL